MALPPNHSFNEIRVSCHSPSVGSTPIAAYMLAPIAGSIVKVGGVINGAISVADCSVAVAINGTAVTGSPFVIANAASAAGTNATMIPTGANVVSEDDYISFTPSGATGSTITGNFFAIIRPTV